MDTFLTWNYLLTFAGCLAATALITEFLKKLFDNIPAQLISYLIALAILLIGQFATGKLTGWDQAVLDAINAVAVSLSANGGYDAVKALFGKKTDAETELTNEGDE